MLKNLDLQRPRSASTSRRPAPAPTATASSRSAWCAWNRAAPAAATAPWSTREMPIPVLVTAVHGISDQDVSGAPTLAAVAPEIHALFEGADLCGFNSIGFDAPNWRRRCAASARRSSSRAGATSTPCASSTSWSPTPTAAYRKFCGKDLADAHAALADVEATLEVLDAMVGPRHAMRAPSGDVDDLHR